jgi:hypothetical protein
MLGNVPKRLDFCQSQMNGPSPRAAARVQEEIAGKSARRKKARAKE